MNDSEDIVHPLYLKLFNYLIPRMDMIQLPVFPMMRRWWDFTAGHYADEFAENHARDMLAREILSKSVPSAGVGSGYSRRALELLAEDSNNQLFNIESLTEDYDFGLRMHKFGLRQVFVRQVLRHTVTEKNFMGKTRLKVKREYIAIREFFPRTFTAAVKQKSRWIMGISLQGWANLGWQGNLLTRYMFFRDREKPGHQCLQACSPTPLCRLFSASAVSGFLRRMRIVPAGGGSHGSGTLCWPICFSLLAVVWRAFYVYDLRVWPGFAVAAPAAVGQRHQFCGHHAGLSPLCALSAYRQSYCLG